MSVAETQTRTLEIASHDEAVSAARAFASQISDGVHERDREGSLPVKELACLDRSGLLSITVPREHGGGGLTSVTLAEVARSIAAVDPAIAQVGQGHFLFVDVVAAFGSREQQQSSSTTSYPEHASRPRSQSVEGRMHRSCRPGCRVTVRAVGDPAGARASTAASTTPPAR